MHDFQINVWPVWNSILNLHYSRKGVNNMQAKILLNIESFRREGRIF